MIGRTWECWASQLKSGEYWHIGERWWVDIHYSNSPTVPVLVEEWLGPDTSPEVTHYGWEDADRPRAMPSMIQVRTGDERPMKFLSMCFPYGLQAAVDCGQGRVVALRVTARRES
ncbi:MAG: hypothetical protein ACTHU0_02715 [Kofleriaceae bacterium]